MPDTMPSHVLIIFISTVALTFFMFVLCVKRRVFIAFILAAWLLLQAVLSLNGFYINTSALPPHFTLALLPALIVIVILFLTAGGKRFIDEINLRVITLLSIVRIPVEITLYELFLEKAVPGLMTFEGRNFDILSGITAPVVYFVCFKGDTVAHKKLLLLWNIISSLLLLNIVVNAILSAPFPFQQFAFDQPNVAVLYFPFIWLPSFIVMVVLFSHLVLFRRLLKK